MRFNFLIYDIINKGDKMNGILLINKPAKMTSHDVVARLRKILHMKKIGHSGTLDPDATGVLLVMLGTACKALPYLEDKDKEYIATLELGKRTTTDDSFGETVETKEIIPIENFSELLQTFVGKQKQLPPMISSIRVNGKKLYEYARQNEMVERPLRDVEFYDIELLDEATMKFRVHCSSGTYIRSLCRDLAEKSDNLGCMSSLVRTKVGRFSLEDCYTLEDIEQGNYQLHRLNEAFKGYPQIEYSPIEDVYNGKTVRMMAKEDTVVIVHKEEVVAIYKRNHDNWFSCARGLW